MKRGEEFTAKRGTGLFKETKSIGEVAKILKVYSFNTFAMCCRTTKTSVFEFLLFSKIQKVLHYCGLLAGRSDEKNSYCFSPNQLCVGFW